MWYSYCVVPLAEEGAREVGVEILALTRFARRGKDLPDVFSDFGTEAVNVGGPAFEKATMLIDARRPRVGLKLDDEMGVQGVAATILLTDTVHS